MRRLQNEDMEDQADPYVPRCRNCHTAARSFAGISAIHVLWRCFAHQLFSRIALVQLNQARVRGLAPSSARRPVAALVLRHPTSARSVLSSSRARTRLHTTRKRLTTALPGNWTLDTRRSEARPRRVRLPSAAQLPSAGDHDHESGAGRQGEERAGRRFCAGKSGQQAELLLAFV